MNYVRVGGYIPPQPIEDYNDLPNIPVISQDLTASGFTPIANTYYKHTGATTASYTNGVIYYYNSTGYIALDGSAYGLATVAKTGSYNDLSNKPTIPDAANNGTLTIQKNGTNVATFGANQSTNTTANITVPTKASDIEALPISGGYITGNLTVGGNLTINGTTTTVDSTTLQVKDKLIEVAHGNTEKLTSPAGIVAPKYDGTNSGALVFNGDGIASVGDVVLDASGNIDVTQSNLQPLATRTGLVNDNLVKYDGTNQTLVDTGKKISDFATAAQVNAKQNALTETQLAAVDSGITEAKRTKYDGYEEIINQKANSADLATVATSGSYNDLSNKPTIPTDYVKYTAQTLTQAQKSQARSNIGAGTSNFDGTWGSLSGKPNVVQSTGNSTSDVMSQKAVTDELNKKYTKPESGIPKSDLATGVQTSLDKADSALQSAPVTSVNGKTGAVQLGASDVGALPTSTKYVVSVNGESGEVKNIAKTNSANTFTGDQTVTGNGSVSGNLTVGGNLTINGTTTTVDSTTLQVKDKLIEVAHGNTTTLTTPAGLVAPKYDGTNSGALVFDSTGTAYVGDVTLKDGNIDVAKSGLQPLATRTGLVGGNLVQYDSSAQTLKDSGKKISDLATTSQVNAKYTKPSGGVPKTDLASDVQTSLGKADNAMPKSGGTFTGEVTFGNTENFQGYYIKRMIGGLGIGTAYANLNSSYKDGTWHRMWRLRFPSGSNFWGKIKITLYGGYSSFNASGVMSKSITCNFNTSNIYNNVGCYDGLGVNVEQDFRISEAIWNATVNAWEVLIWQKNLNGNNSPAIMLECWTRNDTNYINAFNGITAQTVELTQSTSYSAQRASSTGGTKTVEWATLPVYENPLGEEIATMSDIPNSVKSVIDYNKADERIKIGYAGASLFVDDIKYIAGYTAGDSESVARIKDIPKDKLKSWLEYATVAESGSYNDLSDKPTIPDISGKLDKTKYEVNKTINFGQNGALYIGKFKVYDTNVTFEITSTTSVTYSGKLVIAAQNYVISEAKVYGDAANTVTPNIYIKPSTTSDPYIEVYFKPESWSKNVVHIYGSNIQAEPTNVCTNEPSIPSTATLKPKNALPIYSLSGTTLTITL